MCVKEQKESEILVQMMAKAANEPRPNRVHMHQDIPLSPG